MDARRLYLISVPIKIDGCRNNAGYRGFEPPRFTGPSCKWTAITWQGENLDRNIKVAIWSMGATNPTAKEVGLANERLGAGPLRNRGCHIIKFHDFFLSGVDVRPALCGRSYWPTMSGVSIAKTGQALGAIGQAVFIAPWDACIVPLATDHVRYINID
jgi:hypothetical protein